MFKKIKNFEITEKTIYNIIVFIFLTITFLCKFIDNYIPTNFIIFISFFTFKMIFNYKKCTFSYLECKYRNVKREDGFLAGFLDHVVDLRESKYKILLYSLSFILISLKLITIFPL